MKFKTYSYLIISFLFIFVSCSKENNQQSLRERKLREITLPTKITILDFDTSNTEFLPDSLSKDLNDLTQKNFSVKPRMQLNYEPKWAIGYKIKTDKDFDILIVEQGTTSKIRCLITISKKPPIKIISSIIVAIDNYKETNNVIESELWASDISHDLTVKVNRQYEKIENSNNINLDENLENENIFTSEEKFKILPTGMIEFIKKPKFVKNDSLIIDKKYNVAVIYLNKLDPQISEYNEEWLLNSNELENICNYNSIQTQYCYNNFDSVFIKNPHGKIVDTINIKNFVNENKMGFILAKNNKTPIYFPFKNNKEYIEPFSQYFDMPFIIKE